MKYIVTTGRTEILVNNRSVPGIVGMLLQSCGRAVTYLRVEPQLNQDVGGMDLRLKGEGGSFCAGRRERGGPAGRRV